MAEVVYVSKASIERVNASRHRSCSVYRSLEKAIEITTSLEVEE